MTRPLKTAAAETGLESAERSRVKITRIASHVLQYEMPEEPGYSQQLYRKRTAHIVEVETDAGIAGWGECFGPGAVSSPASPPSRHARAPIGTRIPHGPHAGVVRTGA